MVKKPTGRCSASLTSKCTCTATRLQAASSNANTAEGLEQLQLSCVTRVNAIDRVTSPTRLEVS